MIHISYVKVVMIHISAVKVVMIHVERQRYINHFGLKRKSNTWEKIMFVALN